MPDKIYHVPQLGYMVQRPLPDDEPLMCTSICGGPILVPRAETLGVYPTLDEAKKTHPLAVWVSLI